MLALILHKSAKRGWNVQRERKIIAHKTVREPCNSHGDKEKKGFDITSYGRFLYKMKNFSIQGSATFNFLYFNTGTVNK